MKEQLYSVDLTAMPTVAATLVRLMTHCRVLTFEGTLGAGKTTLIQQILALKGVKQSVTSPTFTYVQTYHNAAGETFCHFDLYRLSSLQEFLAAGFDELLYAPNSWCLIEWPELIMPLLHTNWCRVVIDFADRQRTIKIVSF